MSTLLASAAGGVTTVNKGLTRSFKPGKSVHGLTINQPAKAGKTQAAKKAGTRAQDALNLPWTSDIYSNGLTGFTVIDANDDERSWGESNGMANSSYSPKDPMDDWLVTPALNMVGGHAYTVKFIASAYSSAYNERIEVKFGEQPTVEALNTVVLTPTVISGTAYKEYTGVIVPRTSGATYIGFHCISDADMNGLLIPEISVTEGATGEMPAGVKDLTISTDDPYSLNVKISFEAPTTTMSGAPLTSIDNIKVYRDDTLVKTFDNPAPGASFSFDDTVEKGGEHTYSVIASNANGEGHAMEYTYIIGGIAPMYPENVVIKEIADGVLHLTWDPVTKDIEGNTIPEGFINYVVLDSEMTIIAADLTAPELDFSVNTDEQFFLQVIVAAYNSIGGLSEGSMSNLLAVGPPATGFKESFPNKTLKSPMAVGYEFGYVDYVTWDIADDTTFTDEVYMESITSSDKDNGFAYMYCEYRDTGASLFTGKISLPSEGPDVEFDIYNQTLQNIPDKNLLEILVSEDNGFTWNTVMAETVFDLCGSERGWHKVKVGLHEYAGKTVQIRWQVTIESFGAFLIDNIRVSTLPENDLKIWKFNAPDLATVGQKVDATMSVVNMGAKDSGKYTVSLYVDDKVAKEVEFDSLEAGKTNTVTIPVEISPVAEGELNIYAKVNFANATDADLANNETPVITIKLEQPVHPFVTNLTGHIDDNGMVNLSWSKPLTEVYAPGKLESFEDGEDFTQEFGDWIFIDRDQNPCGQLYPNTIPGITFGETKASFVIMNASHSGFTESMHSHSGDKYIASIFAAEPGQTTDDWAITPELNGTSQVISFYARSLSEYYPETMEIYYSFGSTNPDDFIMITKVDKVPGEWTQYNIPVPAGAKRFAVRNHSFDAMALLLDDFYFADSNSVTGIELEKYNIYCDAKAVGSAEADATSFSHPAQAGTHVYAVTAVYKDLGESKASNKVELRKDASGVNDIANANSIKVTALGHAIRISGLQGETYRVFDTTGKTIAADAANSDVAITVAPGIYLVSVGTTTVKVVVK